MTNQHRTFRVVYGGRGHAYDVRARQKDVHVGDYADDDDDDDYDDKQRAEKKKRGSGLRSQGIVVTHPSEDGAALHILLLAVAESLDIGFGPSRLLRDGEVDVGHVGGLEQRVAAVRVLFGDDHDGAETKRAVRGELSMLGLERRRPLAIDAFGIPIPGEEEESEGENDEQRQRTLSTGGEHGGRGGGEWGNGGGWRAEI